jgi:hypothetical protein
VDKAQGRWFCEVFVYGMCVEGAWAGKVGMGRGRGLGGRWVEGDQGGVGLVYVIGVRRGRGGTWEGLGGGACAG